MSTTTPPPDGGNGDPHTVRLSLAVYRITPDGTRLPVSARSYLADDRLPFVRMARWPDCRCPLHTAGIIQPT
ncbi:hypothetical protein ACIRBX_12360 [Kitasatospora sp. NPDC096147]|uniref:hypothetical protein n=1 Tax=Kitasatospora sp. NPDC096147 TaxID=3364093 RepID=UPI0037FDE607